MPGVFNGKVSENKFEMEAYVSTLAPGGKRVKSSEVPRQKPKK